MATTLNNFRFFFIILNKSFEVYDGEKESRIIQDKYGKGKNSNTQKLIEEMSQDL
jgi:hypothetical protein